MKNDSHLKQQDGDPQSDHSSDHYSPLPNQTQQTRRPRGFAALTTATGGGGRKEREKEKERTKLRERHRRAITSRMLAGLRQYGNFPLPARADMNDVLAALAREAGWIVEVDGTTFRPSPPPPHMVPYSVRSIESPISSASLKNCSLRSSLDCQPSILRIDESLSPVSLDSVVVSNRDTKGNKYTNANAVDSHACLEADELMQQVHTGEHGNDFSRTPYVPVYVMLGIGVINNFCQLIDPEGIRQELSHLKSLNVDGVTVDCWWGIVERWTPQKYEWSGYRDLFSIIRDFDLKVQVVMAFHEYDSDGVVISLPEWIIEIGKENKDIFFTNRQGATNSECLSWSIDKERALKGRTAIEVYFDMMRSFRTEFDDFFIEGVITGVEIGLGASGELKYPSFSERMGWSYPGIGEFQCYDKYSLENLRKAAKLRGHSFWGRVPDNSGHYNSKPNETGFFCDKGDYDSYYGRFFLHWYSHALIDHADNVLSLATLAFEDIHIIVKIPSVYWWYRTSSHAAELTAGYYNPINRDGYSQLFEILKKHSATIKFMSPPGFQEISCEEINGAFADPEGLSWQVLNMGWDKGLSLAGQNAVPCYDRDGLMRIVEIAKPSNHPDRRHLSFFTFHLPQPLAQTTICFSDIDYFIKCMHGEIAGN